jgi:predicted NAD/FAD-binding protein
MSTSEPQSRPALSTASRQTVAVVGAGISGLTAAYLLRDTHDVTLFEADARLGGHAHTHTVDSPGGPLAVDSGFIVLNDRTYPLLRRLFDHLGVEIVPTEMSMGISCAGCGLAYVGGRGVRGVFAQPRRLGDPRFWRLLRDVRRFQRLAGQLVEQGEPHESRPTTYGEFLDRHGFGDHFVAHYALPVVTCVWSSGHRDALDYPAAHLFEFLANHGFLTPRGAPQWYVVRGGSAAYVARIRERLADVRPGTAVTTVTRKADRVAIVDEHGVQHEFDRLVIATHADQALRMLADPTEDEFSVLGAFGYSANRTTLHTDDSVLPSRDPERASWNLRLASCDDQPDSVRVSYSMNRLQHHADSQPLVVSLNDGGLVDGRQVIAEMRYEHPTYTTASVAAQRRLPSLATERTAFAGAYHGWGFHEDGCRSGVEAARHFGAAW